MTTDYAGIDYGLGRSNIGSDGIRYGVINQNAVGQAWYDDAEPILENFYDYEPIGYNYSDNEYTAECTDDMGDIFITMSIYYTYAQFCSPCAPGAVHLENPLTDKIDNNRGYCFGHDWFEGGVAPYPVYSVDTGKLINPSKKEG